MKTLISIVTGLVVTAALLAPLPAYAQRRAPDDGGGGSEPRTAGGRSSDSESRPEPTYRPESPAPSASPRSEPVTRVESQPARRVTGAPAAAGAATSTSGRRIATERPAVGMAGPRRPGDPNLRPNQVIYRPVYLSSVFGYDPWSYGRYGYGSYWGSPFAFGYFPGYGSSYYYGYGYPSYYGAGYYGSGYAAGAYEDEQGAADAQLPSGAVRFRVSPTHARIYIDGALAGTVDDFDGLSNHLRLTAGSHAYELRADGYRSHVGVLTVVAGETRTERVNLERAQ